DRDAESAEPRQRSLAERPEHHRQRQLRYDRSAGGVHADHPADVPFLVLITTATRTQRTQRRRQTGRGAAGHGVDFYSVVQRLRGLFRFGGSSLGVPLWVVFFAAFVSL